VGQHRDIKLNFDDLGEIKNEIKNYIDALEDLQDASERFVSVIDEQKGDTFTELRKEYDDCISVDHSDLIEILYNVHDNLGNYMRDMQDLIAPENSGMLCRVDRNDIWWNLEQIKAIPHQCLSDHPSVPSHSYFDEFVNPLSPKAAEIQARNEEKRRRRERNYNKLVDFYNNVFYPTMDSIKDDIKKMYEIYDEYVVEYENTDDIYAKKLDEIYDSIKTWKDVAGDIWDGTKSFFKGFGTGIVDLAKGLKAPLEVSMAINVPLPLGMRLALLNDGGQEIYRGVKTFIKDPENNAGAIFQGMADTSDEEGIAYTSGYATEKVVEIILAKKLGEVMEGGTATEAASEGMEGAESGLSYGGEYEIQEVRYSPVKPGPLSEDVANTFNGATYTERVLLEDTEMYRVSGGSAGKVGRYVTTVEQNGGLQSQLDLALNPQWNNTTENVGRVVVPKGTHIFEGIAAPQDILDSLGNKIGSLIGGGKQIYLPELEESWFK